MESVAEESRESADSTSTVLSDGPAEIDAPRGEAGSEDGEHEAVAVRELLLLVPFRERDRNRRAHRRSECGPSADSFYTVSLTP